MRKNLLTGLATLCVMGSTTISAQAITTSAFDSAANMAAAISGTGITISNAAYSGADGASGYFTGGTAAGIGIESGIVLTTGAVTNLDGSTNTNSAISTSNGVAGSPILNALVPGYTTHDASTLSFDFAFTNGLGGDAYFNFVFGSDEYNEWVNSAYNDVFGFFLDGTAIGNNVALIPGTITPVSINNVNNGSNAAYYNDNAASAFAFEYDGFTDVFTVEMLGLAAGDHTLTIAIADAGDSALDSGVFIQGSSFGDTPPDAVPEPATMFLFGTGLIGLVGFSAKRKKK